MTTLQAIEVTEAIEKFVDAKIDYTLSVMRGNHNTSTDKVDKAKFELLELLETI